FTSPVEGRPLTVHRIHQRRFLMHMKGFVWFLSHDPQNQELARDLGAPDGLDVQTRFLKEGLPDDDCRALVVDLDSVAPESQAQQKLVKELSGRPYPYPVAAVGYSLEDEQVRDLQTAGIRVFRHGLGPGMFGEFDE